MTPLPPNCLIHPVRLQASGQGRTLTYTPCTFAQATEYQVWYGGRCVAQLASLKKARALQARIHEQQGLPVSRWRALWHWLTRAS